MRVPATTHSPRPDADPRQVRVPARHAGAVLDDDEVAVAAGVVAGGGDAAAAGRGDRRPARGREVDAGVQAVAARAEAVAERGRDRPAKRSDERGGDRRSAASVAGPGDAVGGEPGPGLEALERGDAARRRAAVERAGREAVGGEQELQRGDVPALGAGADRARLPTGGGRAQPSARRVRGPTTPSTTSPCRACKRRTASLVAGPADAVDRGRVAGLCAQRDLESRRYSSSSRARRAQQPTPPPSRWSPHLTRPTSLVAGPRVHRR